MGIIKKFRIKSFKNPQPLISLENVSLSFGKRKILENVSRNFKWKILSIFLIYHRMNLDQL